MKKMMWLGAAALVLSAVACSSSSGNTTSAATTPKAPQLDTVEKMTGALHLMWVNQETSCDTIEAERRANMADGTAMEQYKVVFSVPGDADNKMDPTATDNMTYTYRLRCKKGANYSDYSNEKGLNPKQ